MQRPSAKSQVPERSALSACTHFPFIGSMTSCSRATSEHSGLNGGKASDWLRLNPWLESRFHPKQFALFGERYPFGALRLHIPSRLEGTQGVVGKKAGGLVDARHISGILSSHLCVHIVKKCPETVIHLLWECQVIRNHWEIVSGLKKKLMCIGGYH